MSFHFPIHFCRNIDLTGHFFTLSFFKDFQISLEVKEFVRFFVFQFQRTVEYLKSHFSFLVCLFNQNQVNRALKSNYLLFLLQDCLYFCSLFFHKNGFCCCCLSHDMILVISLNLSSIYYNFYYDVFCFHDESLHHH